MPPDLKRFNSPQGAEGIVEITKPDENIYADRLALSSSTNLAELIDIAERHNPKTRVAWENARQAAIDVGMSRASFLPQITLSAMGGYQLSALPLPKYLSPRGYLTSGGAAFYPKLELDYLLLDFGQSRARVEEAQQKALAANFGFTAMHQQLILDVIQAYYSHEAAQTIVKTSRAAIENSTLLLQSAEALRNHGEATVVDVAIARRNLAQSHYDCDKATDTEHVTRYSLLAVLGLPPTTELDIHSPPNRLLPQLPSQKLDDMINTALRARPDILEDVAKLRASRAAVNSARADLRPTISLAGSVSAYLGEMTTSGLGQPAASSAIARPEAGAFLEFSWPIFQGGLRANSIHLAESRQAQAEATLATDKIAVERNVADSQDALETALAQVRSAQVLRDAAQTAYDSASQSYTHGIGTLTDASTAVTALYRAQSALAVSTADAFVKAASLAHATGQLFSGPRTPEETDDTD
ncbi:TolC family protein [Acetobacter sacchari]|uniref:Protein CyaE n=1 Tax=Acetobacter sacchari TaxID=2661687 RepID=A0ABS3M151_9PROT|nr:TolC family protein [Acetobacter sacchari]MBO1361864.1 TolC family protein [Acetobacter sacchari]